MVDEFGSFDQTGRYSGQPGGASETDFEQDVIATLRVLRWGQVGVLVPLVETHRTATGVSDTGGGLGDVTLNGRYDFSIPGDSKIWPGIGVIVGVTLPTGTAVEDSMSPLGAGATGTGAWQVSGGASAEQTFGQVFVGVTGLLSYRFARSVGQVDEQLGLRLTVVGASGWVWKSGGALVGTVSFSDEGDATLNGRSEPDSGQRQTTLGVAGTLPINLEWRLTGSVFSDLPVAGQNHPAGMGATVVLLRAWM